MNENDYKTQHAVQSNLFVTLTASSSNNQLSFICDRPATYIKSMHRQQQLLHNLFFVIMRIENLHKRTLNIEELIDHHKETTNYNGNSSLATLFDLVSIRILCRYVKIPSNATEHRPKFHIVN